MLLCLFTASTCSPSLPPLCLRLLLILALIWLLLLMLLLLILALIWLPLLPLLLLLCTTLIACLHAYKPAPAPTSPMWPCCCCCTTP